MQEDTQLIEEVVVVGYGTLKKSDVTGAISSVKGSDITTACKVILPKHLQDKFQELILCVRW